MALHETIQDAQEAVQDAQEELRGNAQQTLELEQRNCKTSKNTSCVSRTQESEEEQVTQAACSKAVRTHLAVEEQQPARRQSLNTCGMEEINSRQAASEQKYAACENGVHVPVQRWKHERSQKQKSYASRLARDAVG